jgi:hypothetical protein
MMRLFLLNSSLVVVVVVLSLGCATAFSAVAPNSVTTTPASSSTNPAFDVVDKTLTGIDAAGSFDPTDGDYAAVQRNNKDEVWVNQVRRNFSSAKAW